MKKPPTSIPPLARRLVPRDGLGLFAFVRTLRLAVRARVAADQKRGIALAENVVPVREMVNPSEEAASHSRPRPPAESRAISKRADAWCLEAYRLPPGQSDQPGDRFPIQSPT